MKKKEYYIDFDGVIIDSRKVVINIKQGDKDTSWNDFLNQLDWKKVYQESLVINDAIELIKQAKKIKVNMKIITKVHTILEMNEKVNYIRNNMKLDIPIIFVPNKYEKSDIINVFKNMVLIDDNNKNVNDWIKHGGIGILFEKNNDASNLNLLLEGAK